MFPASLFLLAVVVVTLPGDYAVGQQGPLAVSASLEPVEIRVGDIARLTVIVDHPAGGVVTLPDFERGNAVQVTDRQHTTTAVSGEAAGGRERTTFVLSLTSFEVGEHGVGGGAIAYSNQSGTTLTAAFPATVVRTRSLLRGESTPMRGVREPLRWPPAIRRWVGVAAGAVLVAAAVLVGLRRRKTRVRPSPAAGPAVRPPHEEALKALAALKGRKLTGQRDVEVWYGDLSSIVRQYLEDRFGLHAPERTTEELIRETAGSDVLGPAQRELVQLFLSQCDLVKFARYRASPDDQSRAMAAAESLVRETKPPAAQHPASGRRVARR